jgi:hypothetical protein
MRLPCGYIISCVLALALSAGALEPFIVLPEPRVLRSTHSVAPKGAQHTVFTPARELATLPWLKVYDEAEFKKLGISPESFIERAGKAADARLALLQPEFIKDDTGKTRYAVYRGESPLIASLIVAPSLGKNFTALFGDALWAVLPDRNSLYIFPAKPELLDEFAADLAERYEFSPYAASCEVFRLRVGQAPEVVASFSDG